MRLHVAMLENYELEITGELQAKLESPVHPSPALHAHVSSPVENGRLEAVNLRQRCLKLTCRFTVRLFTRQEIPRSLGVCYRRVLTS